MNGSENEKRSRKPQEQSTRLNCASLFVPRCWFVNQERTKKVGQQTTDGPNLVYTAKHRQKDVSLKNSKSSLNSTDGSFDVDPDGGDFLRLHHLGLCKMRLASLERRNVENQVRLDKKILNVEAAVRHDSLACRN